MSIRVGNLDLKLGKTLLELDDSTPLYQKQDFKTLYQKLQDDGYLFIRKVINSETIKTARLRFLQQLQIEKTLKNPFNLLDSTMCTPHPGFCADAESGGLTDGQSEKSLKEWQKLGNSKELRNVYAGIELNRFYSKLFKYAKSPIKEKPFNLISQSRTATIFPTHVSFPGCTWLRAKGSKEVTAEHTDYYYFKKESRIFADFLERERIGGVCCQDEGETIQCDLCEKYYHLKCLFPPLKQKPLETAEFHCHSCSEHPLPYYTCWVALGDVRLEDGRLCLLPGSHRWGGYAARHHSKTQLLPRLWNKQRQVMWRSSDLEPGDVILFNVKTIHAASRNLSNRFRLSLDTRVTSDNSGIWRERIGKDVEIGKELDAELMKLYEELYRDDKGSLKVIQPPNKKRTRKQTPPKTIDEAFPIVKKRMVKSQAITEY